MSPGSVGQQWSPLRPPEMTILADHAILHGDGRDDDLLDLGPKLAAVFDILRNKRTQTPIAVAIYGGWGTGKSSAMRWLRDRLRQCNALDEKQREGHPAIETVWFDPWKYQTREDVWRGLIAEVILGCLDVGRLPPDTKVQWIERAARQFGAYVGRPFLAALARVKVKGGVGTPLTNVEAELSGEAFTAVLDELRKVRKPQEPYLNEFESALQNWVREFFPQDTAQEVPRRLAVLIDDLDRCLPAVSLQVLEALKLYLNIPGLLFVVGLDRQVLDAVVCTEYAKHGIGAEKSRDYLAKMFQVQVDIPPTQTQAREFLTTQIADLNRVSGGVWSDLLNMSSLGQPGSHREIIEGKIGILGSDNPREIKRLLNSVMLRAWAAAQNDKLGGEGTPEECRARRFAQGAQVFLVQRFLWRGLEREDLLLRDDVQRFFERWSQFVAKFPGYRPGKQAARVEAEPTPEDQRSAPVPSTPRVLDLASPSAHERALGIQESMLAEQAFAPLRIGAPDAQVLADPHLWDLMRIPFSVAVASVSVAQPPTSAATVLSPQPPPRTDPTEGDSRLPPLRLGPPSTWPRPLAVAIARALDKPVSNLTEDDALQVRKLDFSGNTDLVDLTPLAELTQLQRLDLDGTGVTNLRPLKPLTQLQNLGLNGNADLVDLTPLVSLTQLRGLGLNDTGVKDLGPLKSLTQLQVLGLGGTGVTDLGPLAALTQLHVLYLVGTRARDLSPLASLTQLWLLDLTGTRATDLSPLASLTQLQVLDLTGTSVTDLGPLASLTQLQSLDMRGTCATDLRPLVSLVQLQRINLIGTGVTDLRPLRGLTQVIVYIEAARDIRIPPELEDRVKRV